VCERQRDREKIIITIPRIKNTFTPTFTQIRGDNTPIIAVLKKGGLFHLYKIWHHKFQTYRAQVI
jgi:hypothetical protein